MKRLIQLTILGCLPLSALCDTVSDKQTAIETLNKQSTTKAIAKIQTDKNPLLKASYEISPKFISKSNIKKTLSISQLSGGGVIDLGGGDAAAMTEGYNSKNRNYYTTIGEIDWDQMLSDRKTMTLYSLDLIEVGMQYSVNIDINNDFKNSNDSLCVDDHGCYIIEDTDYFQELMDYGGFFGLDTGVEMRSDSKEFAYSKELKQLFTKLGKENLTRNQLTLKYSLESMFKIEETPEMKRLNIEISKVDLLIQESKDNYTDAVNKYFPTYRKNIYSEDTILAIGIINKLKEIKKLQPEFSKLLADELLDLDWEIVDLPLKDIKDEGHVAVKADKKVQIAHRRNGIVKVSREGWKHGFELDEVFISPMDSSNKIALIFHEVIYQITKKDGDKTGERARLITGLLFKNNRVARNMKRAFRELNNK